MAGKGNVKSGGVALVIISNNGILCSQKISHKPKGFHQDSGWWAVLLGLQPQGGLLLAAGAIEKQFSIANSTICWKLRQYL